MPLRPPSIRLAILLLLLSGASLPSRAAYHSRGTGLDARGNDATGNDATARDEKLAPGSLEGKLTEYPGDEDLANGECWL